MSNKEYYICLDMKCDECDNKDCILRIYKCSNGSKIQIGKFLNQLDKIKKMLKDD